MTALSAGLFLGAFSAVTGFSTDAEARTYTKSRYVNNDRCYRVKRIPQLVEVDTMGKLLRGSSRSWVGNAQRHGALVIDRYHDPVYIQTERVLEDQHVTLVPVSCR
ncbi:hypothetical protein GGD81_001097 [Rhodobium orientis]|uniref:hypothetical protein n=1 Tax=Rhodobium orientis TaxID=34017 RepID=UPI0011B93FF0|nr:hypothetical protein [Rhodobium orientis]MBB4302073.1 hypothetical protein [Rhodobium orientis]